MRLRYRLLLLFAALGIAPLLVMGAFDYVHSMRALDALLGAQTDLIATRAADELRSRADRVTSDLALLTENQETQTLLRVASSGPSPGLLAALASADRYWDDAWAAVGAGYERAQLLDATERPLLTRSARDLTGALGGGGVLRRRPIRENETGAVVGYIAYATKPDELLGIAALSTRFGSRGWTAIVDPARSEILRSAPPRFGAGALPFDVSRIAAGSGRVAFSVAGGRWIASYASLPDSSMSVVSTASVDEFAGPFVRLRLFDLALLIAVVTAVAIGFFLLLRRATRSLDVLTAAADRVGHGDLSPDLPPGGRDEVGRLSTAFATMTRRLRESLDQIEATRQVAILGRFAAELSHEIRNPLTSIKLNLQSLARDAEEGRIPPHSQRSLDLALREIRRLDEVVRGALRAGRTPSPPVAFSVHGLIDECMSLLEAQAAQAHVRLVRALDAPTDGVTGDIDGLRGAIMNIAINAIEAMPAGGAVIVRTSNPDDETIEIVIADEGAGVPHDVRDHAFQPFATSKPNGTGLGLSLALQSVQAQGGSIRLADREPHGTEVQVTLRLDASAVPA